MAFRDTNAYFIVTKQPLSFSWIHAGNICYKNGNQYSSPNLQKEDTVSVICNGTTYNLPSNVLQPLTRQKSQFLFAVEGHKERLEEFLRPEALNQAVELTVGSEVTVEINGEWLKGVVRYIGPLFEPGLQKPKTAVFFGVELQVSHSLLCVYK